MKYSQFRLITHKIFSIMYHFTVKNMTDFDRTAQRDFDFTVTSLFFVMSLQPLSST